MTMPFALPSGNASALFPFVVACCAGCLGTSYAKYEGTVVVGTEGGYSFDDQPNPDALLPISDAVLAIDAEFPGRTCTSPGIYSTVPGLMRWTNHDGRFAELKADITGSLFSVHQVLICVTHPDYQPFSYQTIFERTPDPTDGDKFLNIRLQKKLSSTLPRAPEADKGVHADIGLGEFAAGLFGLRRSLARMPNVMGELHIPRPNTEVLTILMGYEPLESNYLR
jgi:hypothetical protein